MRLFCKFFFLSCALFSFPLWAAPKVLVSIVPYQAIVEEIAGDTVDVQVVVPPGASAHTYEPTPRQVIDSSRADAWLLIGESFENRAAQAIKGYNPKIELIDLQQGIALIYDSPCAHCNRLGKGSADVHFWLSPRIVKQQVSLIVQTLSRLYPEHSAKYAARGEELQKRLNLLDEELQEIFLSLEKPIVVSHPAYTYLARDYDFEQISVEFEGKDPTPRQLINLLEKARASKIQVVFIQEQHNTKGACRLAQEIQAKVATLDPYRKDYFENLREIAYQFAHS